MSRTNKTKKSGIGLTVALIAIIIISILVLYPIFGSVNTYNKQINSLDDKKDTVLKLVASSSVASAIITIIPDDVGTPIAEQLANLSIGFMIVLAVLFCEKYLLPLLGGLTTGLLIPIICIISIIYYYKRDHLWMRNVIIKLTVISIAFMTLIPVSILASDTIEYTFKASIDNSINKALDSENTLNIDEPQNKNIWQKITGTVSDAFDYVGKAVKMAKSILGHYVEAIAIMIVVNCLIPLLVLIMYILILRYVFSLNFSLVGQLKKPFYYREKISKKKPQISEQM